MARINYSEDEQYAGQFELWQANVKRSLHGKKGQLALQVLKETLLALPEKRLIRGEIATEEGEVCAIGSVLVHRTPEEKRPELLKELSEFDDYTTEIAPKDFPRLVTWAIVEMNDFELDWVSPEQRYTRMLAWVEHNLIKKEAK